jgi:hypothetical protein
MITKNDQQGKQTPRRAYWRPTGARARGWGIRGRHSACPNLAFCDCGLPCGLELAKDSVGKNCQRGGTRPISGLAAISPPNRVVHPRASGSLACHQL